MAEIALERLGREGAVVPSPWWFEIRNLLVINERRGRIDSAGTASFLADLARLPISVDPAPALVQGHGLAIYDAACLELAVRLMVPLATLDRALIVAAPNAGVELLA